MVRHSGARRCEVRVGPAQLEVIDDGGGFEDEAVSDGTGLAGLRERVRGAGGSLSAGTDRGRGFRLVATFPDRVEE